MINLLPTATRESLTYARRNTKLRTWITALTTVNVILGLTVAGGWLYLRNETTQYWAQVDTGKQALVSQNQAEVKAQVEDLSNSLKLVDQVLSKEVLFSKLLRQVGAVMPAGAVLTNLNIDELTGGLDLQVAAKDYDTGTQAQVNLSDPENKIFESADIVNIQCNSGDDQDADSALAKAYPCTVQLRVLFAKDNPFLFINNEDKP